VTGKKKLKRGKENNSKGFQGEQLRGGGSMMKGRQKGEQGEEAKRSEFEGVRF